jgi:3',5'-cyclic AMP phosphodiesterase CpdA
MLIAQLTDLHVRPRGMLANRVVETNAMLERALHHVAALDPKPDAVIISGDLVDKGLLEEYNVLAELLHRHLSMPTYMVPGNHDRREAMREGLVDFPGIGSDPQFIQYTVDDLPLRLVMLDSIVPGAGHGELCPKRLDFLDRALAAQPEKPTVVVLHHPPIKCGVDFMDEINLHSADAFSAVIAKHPQVERVLCGHSHRPIIKRFAGTIVQVAPSTAHQVSLALKPGAPETLIMEPPAYLLHRWTPADGLVTHQAYIGEFAGPYPFS